MTPLVDLIKSNNARNRIHLIVGWNIEYFKFYVKVLAFDFAFPTINPCAIELNIENKLKNVTGGLRIHQH